MSTTTNTENASKQEPSLELLFKRYGGVIATLATTQPAPGQAHPLYEQAFIRLRRSLLADYQRFDPRWATDLIHELIVFHQERQAQAVLA